MASLFIYLPKQELKYLSTKIKGIDENSRGVYQEQLDDITELNLKDIDVIYLSYFKNLKTLVVDGFPDLEDRNFYYIARNCPNISTLIVKNQHRLTSIDLSRFNNLKNLTIVSNENLVNIEGLSKELLNNLNTLEFYDNLKFKDTKGLIESLSEAKRLRDVKLDALYYLDFEDKSVDVLQNYKWHEKIGYVNQRNISYSKGEMDVAYNYAKSIIDTIIKPNDSDNMKISVIYTWILRNIKMSYERKMGFNDGIVNVFKYREASMPTMAKFFQFLLKVAGVESYDINVLPRVKFNISSLGTFKIPSDDYEIVKIPTLEGERYFDIVWDFDIFNKTDKVSTLFMFNGLEDISYNHKLIFDNSSNSVSMDMEEREEYSRKANKRLQNVKNQMINEANENDDVYQGILKSHSILREQMNKYLESIKKFDGNKNKKIKNMELMRKAIEASNSILKNSVYRLEEALLERLLEKDLEPIEKRLGMRVSPFNQLVKEDGSIVKVVKSKEELNTELKKVHGSLNRELSDRLLTLTEYRRLMGKADEVYTYLITFAYESDIIVDTLDANNGKKKVA